MITLIVWILILGLISYGVSRTPLQNGFKMLAYVACIVMAIVLTLNVFGVGIGLPAPRLK